MIRNTNVKAPPRIYRSALRDEQTDGTRIRILEALVRTMAAGIAGLSVPAVAREAGVSTPTIYRHFGSKQGLLEALQPYVVQKGGLAPDTMPQNIDDFGSMVHGIFHNLDDMDLTLRAAMASQLGQEVRRATMPERRDMIRDSVRRMAPDVPAADIHRLADLALILVSSATFRAYKDYLGLSPDEAADLATWAVRTLVRGASVVREGTR
jgi:AcrR family transcriptional regulator